MSLDKNLQLARTAMQEDNAEDVVRFYDLVRTEDPTNFEAKFFYAYYKIFHSKKIEVPTVYRTFINVVAPCLKLLKNSEMSIEDKTKFLVAIDPKMYTLIKTIVCADIHGYHCWGDNLDLMEKYAQALEENFGDVNEVRDFIINAWKQIYADTTADIFARTFQAQRALATAKLQIYCPDFLEQQQKEEKKRKEEEAKKKEETEKRWQEEKNKRQEEENKTREVYELHSKLTSSRTTAERLSIIAKAISLDQKDLLEKATNKTANNIEQASIKEIIDSDIPKEIKLNIFRSSTTRHFLLLDTYKMGDEFEKNQDFDKELISFAVELWKKGVAWQRNNCYDKVALENKELVNVYANKIKKYEPNYEIPKKRACITIG